VLRYRGDRRVNLRRVVDCLAVVVNGQVLALVNDGVDAGSGPDRVAVETRGRCNGTYVLAGLHCVDVVRRRPARLHVGGDGLDLLRSRVGALELDGNVLAEVEANVVAGVLDAGNVAVTDALDDVALLDAGPGSGRIRHDLGDDCPANRLLTGDDQS